MSDADVELQALQQIDTDLAAAVTTITGELTTVEGQVTTLEAALAAAQAAGGGVPVEALLPIAASMRASVDALTTAAATIPTPPPTP